MAQVIIQEEPMGYTHCRECSKGLQKWKYRVIGYCSQHYRERFPERESKLPPLRRWYHGGWQKLVSPDERAMWRKPFDEIDERIDREAVEKRKA